MAEARLSGAVAVVASLVLFADSVAIAASAADPAVSEPIKNDTGKRVCRQVTPTGTRFTKRVCRTAEEWQKDADNAQRDLEESDRSRREFQPPCGIGCNPH